MAQAFRINTDLINVRHIHKMRPPAFRKAFLAAIRGEGGPLAEYVKPCRDRPSGPAWIKIRAEIFARDDYTCRYCGDRGGRLECDHAIPASRGGESVHDNLVTACFACNRSKRNKTPDEWVR